MLKVQFADVVQQEGKYVILLLEKETQKLLGIWTGFNEGTLLAWLAGGKPQIWDGPARPGTFDFAADLVRQAGLKIQAVAIRALKNNVFYGVVQYVAGEKKVNLDARASDAIALAIQMNLPIYADHDLIARTSWNLESVYRRTTMGKSTEALVDAMRTFWRTQDSRIYLNAVDTQPEMASRATGRTSAVPVMLVDILRKDEVQSRAIFWDKSGRRVLPVSMASWEAANLAWLHGGQPLPPGQPRRPQTYQLLGAMLESASIRVRNVQLRDLRDGVVIGGVEAVGGEQPLRVDARPVDAVGLALLTKAPIFVSEGILNAASVKPGVLYRSRQEVGRGMRQILADMQKQTGRLEEKTGFLQRLGAMLWGD